MLPGLEDPYYIAEVYKPPAAATAYWAPMAKASRAPILSTLFDLMAILPVKVMLQKHSAGVPY